jgi:uncharacterized protein (DUF952 family)
MSSSHLFKIVTITELDIAKKEGVFKGSSLDLQDGYIHCSTADQVAGRREKFFKSEKEVILLTIDTQKITAPIRWEKSPSGNLYPHIYGHIPMDAVVAEKKI